MSPDEFQQLLKVLKGIDWSLMLIFFAVMFHAGRNSK